MRGLAYETLSRRGRGSGFYARMTCHQCAAHGDIKLSAHSHNPEWVAKKFIEKGWEADAHRASYCICPECVAGRRKKLAPVKLPDTNLEKLDMASPDKPLRDPDPDERMKIRGMLDHHFDDKKGYFLDGFSDQKIGQHLGLPWAMVTKIREAAYGPIRTDPEIASIQRDVEAARQQMGTLSESLALVKKLVESAETKLQAAKKRLGIAA